jgi:transaldolase
MQIYADTSNVEEIKQLWEGGLIQGVTTNPSLIAKEAKSDNWHNVIVEICNIVEGPVSAEVVSEDYTEMFSQGVVLNKLHENVVVKLPCTPDGIRVCNDFKRHDTGIKVNMTLCFSVAQAVLAQNAGATYISPFVGRLEDYSAGSGIQLVKDINEAYIQSDVYDTRTNILAASIRNVEHFNEVALHADIATCPPKVIWESFGHKLTVSGLKQFRDDWNKANE